MVLPLNYVSETNRNNIKDNLMSPVFPNVLHAKYVTLCPYCLLTVSEHELSAVLIYAGVLSVSPSEEIMGRF